LHQILFFIILQIFFFKFIQFLPSSFQMWGSLTKSFITV